ncbi:MAG: aminotransferase class III-fold pyridoxal phosphate-dependent enzyme, partial [Desulfobulbia bacterium]
MRNHRSKMPDDKSVPKPNSLEGRDIESIVHPLTNLKAHASQGPLVMARGEGVWVEDIHGNRYIEGMSGLWCLTLGYGQERLVEAATQQMRKLPYY